MTATTPTSVQLYSLREECAADFLGVLRRLGEVGYVGVETAGLNGHASADVARVLADAGLVVSSMHTMDITPDGLRATLDDANTIGCDTVVLAALMPAEFDDAATIAGHAERINAANELARSRGVRLGYHNHWWEFEKQVNGRSAWHELFARLDPTVCAELDLYWAKVGGADPAALVTENDARIRLLHVKDGPADDPQNAMVAVGSGSVDIRSVLQASSADWHVVELDRCATDMFTAVSESYSYLTANGLSRGRK